MRPCQGRDRGFESRRGRLCESPSRISHPTLNLRRITGDLLIQIACPLWGDFFQRGAPSPRSGRFLLFLLLELLLFLLGKLWFLPLLAPALVLFAALVHLLFSLGSTGFHAY